MYFTCSYMAVKGVDTLFTNNYNSEYACSSLETFVYEKNVRCCKGLANKCRNPLSYPSCICHFGKHLAGQGICYGSGKRLTHNGDTSTQFRL